MAGWLSGYGKIPRQAKAPQPAAPPMPASLPGWRKGQTRVQVEVPCCPECGSRYVRIRTPRGALVLMQCRVCGSEWKDQRIG